MAKTLEEIKASLPPERQRKIAARSAQLIAEEYSLRDLRSALALTQSRVATRLRMRQEGVSRLEKRSDLLLSTLRDYLKALGGDLRLVVDFPGRPTVELKGIADLDTGDESMPVTAKRRVRVRKLERVKAPRKPQPTTDVSSGSLKGSA